MPRRRQEAVVADATVPNDTLLTQTEETTVVDSLADVPNDNELSAEQLEALQLAGANETPIDTVTTTIQDELDLTVPVVDQAVEVKVQELTTPVVPVVHEGTLVASAPALRSIKLRFGMGIANVRVPKGFDEVFNKEVEAEIQVDKGTERTVEIPAKCDFDRWLAYYRALRPLNVEVIG